MTDKTDPADDRNHRTHEERLRRTDEASARVRAAIANREAPSAADLQRCSPQALGEWRAALMARPFEPKPAEPVTAASIRDDREVLRKAERIRIRSRFPPAEDGLSVYRPETIITAVLDDGEEVALGDGVAAVTWEERAGQCPVATVDLLGVDLDADALPPRPDVSKPFEPGTYVHHKGGHYAALGLVRDHRSGRELVRYVALRQATRGMPHLGEEVRELEPRAGCDAWNDPVRWPDGQVRSRLMPIEQVREMLEAEERERFPLREARAFHDLGPSRTPVPHARGERGLRLGDILPGVSESELREMVPESLKKHRSSGKIEGLGEVLSWGKAGPVVIGPDEVRLPPHCNGADCKRPLFDGDVGGPCACTCLGCWPVESRSEDLAAIRGGTPEPVQPAPSPFDASADDIPF